MIRTFCVNFCDDIRQEIGNKISLIGMYGADLIVPEIPTVIAKLCIFAQVYGEPDVPFDDDIEIKVTLDHDQIASAVQKPSVTTLEPSKLQRLNCQIIITPFPIAKECTLRVRAYYKGQEYIASALRINSAAVHNENSPEK